MMPGRLARYFGMRFFNVVTGTFLSLFALIMMVDFVELLRRHGDVKDVSAFVIAQISFYRVPHITERIIPFTVLVASGAKPDMGFHKDTKARRSKKRRSDET